MPVTLTSEAYGLKVGDTYTGPEEAWLLSSGYASQDGYTGPGVSNTGATDTTPANDPRLKENREDPQDDYQFGTDTELAPRLEGLDPAEGPAAGGTEVLITGDNLVDATGVTFDGVAGTDFDVIDDNTVVVTTPAGTAGPADVVVTDPTGPTTMADGFTYTA